MTGRTAAPRARDPVLVGEGAAAALGRRLLRVWTVLGSNRKAAAGSAIVLFFVLMAILAPVLAPGNPIASRFALSQAPSFAHPLGTTNSGQDVLAQVIWGARASVEVGLVCASIATALAVIVGMVAGYVGGVVDELLSLMTNVFLVIPALPLIIVLASYIPAHGETRVIMVISFTGWAWGARVMRSITMTLRGKDFVLSARVAGERTWHIVFQEILPNVTSLVAASFMFTCIYAILTEAYLEFLGLGNLNIVSWGTILYWASNSNALMLGAWWWFIPPGLCIGLLGAGFALLNYAIDEITNPRLRAEGVR